jgi:hypothetical protein
VSKILPGSLLFLCLLLLMSCDHPERKGHSAKDFIDTIGSTLDSFTTTGEKFVAYLEVVTPIALSDPDLKLGESKIDSLRNYYDRYMNSLAEGISRLSAMKEFDTSFSIVAPCLYVLKKTKDAFTATFPSYFTIYRVGWDKAGEPGRQIWIASPKILHEANLSSSKEIKNLGATIDRFRRKYALAGSCHSSTSTRARCSRCSLSSPLYSFSGYYPVYHRHRCGSWPRPSCHWYSQLRSLP